MLPAAAPQPPRPSVPGVNSLLVPAALLLFVLPMAHVTAVRSLALVATVVALAVYLRRQRPARPPLLGVFGLWLLVGLASVLGAADPGESLGELKTDVLHSAIGFAACYLLASVPRGFRVLRRVTATSMLLLSTLAALSFALHGEWRNGYHNALGEYSTAISIMLPLVLTALLPGPLRARPREQVLVWLAVAMAAYGAYLARSRGMWIVLALIAVAALVDAARRAGWRRWVLLAATAVVAGGALFAAHVVSKQRNTELTALHDREHIYAFSLGQIAQRPLLGHGFGRETNREAYGQAFPGRYFWHSHNVLLSYGEQMGIPGVAIALALFASLLVLFARLRRHADEAAAQAGTVGLVLVLVFFLKNMSDMFFYGQTLNYFWCHCGLLLGFGQASARAARQAAGRRILVIRTDNIGDLVCTTPLLTGLRRRFPGAWIGVLANTYNAPILAGHPDVDELFVYAKAKHRAAGQTVPGIHWARLRMILRLRAMELDEVIVATPGGNASAHRFARLVAPRRVLVADGAVGGHEVERVYSVMAAWGEAGSPPPCHIVAPVDAVAQARARIPADWAGQPVVGLSISARKPSQRWPVEHYAGLVAALHRERRCVFLLFWSPGAEDDPRHPGDDGKAARLVELCAGLPLLPMPTATLGELMAGLACCDSVVCSDGGAMHVAAGLGKPIVCFFGQSDETRWHPWRVAHRVLAPSSRQVADVSVAEAVRAWHSLPQS